MVQFKLSSKTKEILFARPNPSNVNLKKERPVSIFFNFEGHGDTITLNVSCGVEVGFA
ncbi:hypothetical protein DAPPUDRAFT_235795 [Daphnia pulex]|uniref:Uncharacterized protein n=1 Tax=Daphnia pulex TaxID=6669 RepID=E9G0V6_DAPPU|nr:hypothetical protein DAPPUDRAFT_235795 [Daphnia pulex]|eukprot:EFX86975.1 hypothetical protein DAPPUDRAFT_235795 [Daphnia pulex]